MPINVSFKSQVFRLKTWQRMCTPVGKLTRVHEHFGSSGNRQRRWWVSELKPELFPLNIKCISKIYIMINIQTSRVMCICAFLARYLISRTSQKKSFFFVLLSVEAKILFQNCWSAAHFYTLTLIRCFTLNVYGSLWVLKGRDEWLIHVRTFPNWSGIYKSESFCCTSSSRVFIRSLHITHSDDSRARSNILKIIFKTSTF